LPGGQDYAPWLNRNVTVKLGLGENGATYFTVFSGRITEVGGMKRSVKTITIVARDIFDSLTEQFPKAVLSNAVFPFLEDSLQGKLAPVIYGDWTTNLDTDPAAIPTFIVNGADPNVSEDEGPRQPVDVLVTTLALAYLDVENIYLKKGDAFFKVPSSDVTLLGGGNNRFTVAQKTPNLWVEDKEYTFASGDAFYVRVKGKDLGLLSDNIVWQARDILTTYGNLANELFDANWLTLTDKAAPSQSAIKFIKSRIYETEAKPVIQYVLSLLEQVRLEAYVSREQKLKLHSLHFEDWQVNAAFQLKNWDIVKDTFQPGIDERNNFNRARANFNFLPSRNENAAQTPILVNAASVTQIGKAISKQITFPNLYESEAVKAQLREILKISSSLLELGTFSVTWRSALRDIGDIISVNISIGSTVLDTVPVMIRDIGYDPAGLKLPLRVWILALCPFPAYQPGYPGTKGGFSAAITEE
jgi:hypothetical protein